MWYESSVMICVMFIFSIIFIIINMRRLFKPYNELSNEYKEVAANCTHAQIVGMCIITGGVTVGYIAWAGFAGFISMYKVYLLIIFKISDLFTEYGVLIKFWDFSEKIFLYHKLQCVVNILMSIIIIVMMFVTGAIDVSRMF